MLAGALLQEHLVFEGMRANHRILCTHGPAMHINMDLTIVVMDVCSSCSASKNLSWSFTLHSKGVVYPSGKCSGIHLHVSTISTACTVLHTRATQRILYGKTVLKNARPPWAVYSNKVKSE